MILFPADFFFTLSQMRNWEEKLQIAAGEDNVDELRALAEDQLRVYRENLPKPGADQAAGSPTASHVTAERLRQGARYVLNT